MPFREAASPSIAAVAVAVAVAVLLDMVVVAGAFVVDKEAKEVSVSDLMAATDDQEEVGGPEGDEDLLLYYDDGDSSNGTSLVYLNSSDYAAGRATNATRHAGFAHGLVEALSVILVSEVGDKTFFIAAILAMSSNRLVVFLSAISALALMTVLSSLLGWVVTKFIPTVYTHYACTVMMFLFGLKMLWDAWRMSPDETQEIQQEVQAELERRGSIASNRSQQSQDDEEEGGGRAAGEATQNSDEATATAQVQHLIEQREMREEEEGGGDGRKEEVRVKRPDKPKKTVQIREKSLFGKRCYKIFKLFVNCFTMTFLAEWGDRSQLATIVLAGINDVGGVCVGGVLGHALCTGAAVLAGALVARRISARTVAVVGAVVFLGFACASLALGPGDGQTEVKVELDAPK